VECTTKGALLGTELGSAEGLWLCHTVGTSEYCIIVEALLGDELGSEEGA